MTEAVRTSLRIDPQPRLDGEQFDALQEATGYSEGVVEEGIVAKEAYQLLTVPAARRAELLADYAETGTSPGLTATHLDTTDLAARHERLADFKTWLLGEENADVPADIIQVYRWKINELIANNRMLQASLNGDMVRFRRYNTFIYGEPNPEVVAGVADWFRSDALKHVISEHESVREAADEVLRLVEDRGGSKFALVPDPETFQRVRAEHFREGTGYYALLLAGVMLPEGARVTNEVGDPALEQVRANLGADHYKTVDAPGGTWGVDNRRGEVSRPAKINMIYERFVGLGVGHEWGSHVLEYLNGLDSALALAAVGFDRYESGNESRALIREEVVYESFAEFAATLRWQDIMRREFAIALGHGVGGRGPMPFDQVDQIISAVDRLWERAKTPNDPIGADVRALKRTDDLLMRVIKGTDGKGGAYLKDMVYLDPHPAMWRAAGLDPRIIGHGDLLKSDILNPRHTAIAQKYGIIPIQAVIEA